MNQLNRRSLLVGFVMGGALPAVGASAQKVPVEDPQWLQQLFREAMSGTQIPAMAGAVVRSGKVIAASAAGVRTAGTLEKAVAGDYFHIGSIAKTMTGTLTGRLVDKNLLQWDWTMEQMFPELIPVMQPEYRPVNLRHLLSHTSGLPYAPTKTEGGSAKTWDLRYEYVKNAVADKPQAKLGTQVIYSGGANIVAHAAERATKLLWEDLMRQELIDPLVLSGLRIGGNPQKGLPDVIPGHLPRDGRASVCTPGPEADPKHPRGPVGGSVYCTPAGLGEYLAAYLDVQHGRSNYLSAKSFSVLRTPYSNATYAPGWNTQQGGYYTGHMLWHSGAIQGYRSAACVYLADDLAACIFTNMTGTTDETLFGTLEKMYRKVKGV